MSEATTPFYFQPSRQSPVAILLILARLIRTLVGQFWPILILILLRRRTAGNNQFWVWVGIALTLLSVVRSLLMYFRTRFYIQNDEFIFEKGGFTRRRLTIPLDKIQTINFQQTFLHRVFNVVSLEVDTSGAKDAEITLNALDRAKASELRDYLLRWKKDNPNVASNADEAEAKHVPEQTLLKLDIGDLFRIGLSQNHLRSAGILLGLFASFAREIQPILGKSTYRYLEEELGLNIHFFWSFALWIVGFFLIVSVLATMVLTVIRFFDLRFVQTGDGFRVEAGLFTRREQAAYLPKIQFLRWSANPLQRLWGMFNLRFYQATGAEITRKQTLQVPGCYQTQIDAVKLAYFPDSAQIDWKWHQPNALYFRRRMVLIGIFPLLGLVLKTSLDFSWTWLVLCILWLPVVAWWQWQFFKRVRYGLSEAGLWVKSGFFTQSQTLLMWHNVQAVELEQGFMDARYALADLTLYTASGTVEIEALPLTMVRSLRDFVLAKIEVPKELNM